MNLNQWINLVSQEDFSPTSKYFLVLLKDWEAESKFYHARLEMLIQLNKVYSSYLVAIEAENRKLKGKR